MRPGLVALSARPGKVPLSRVKFCHSKIMFQGTRVGFMLHHLKWKPHHWMGYSNSSKCCLPTIFVQCSYMIDDHSMILRKCTLRWQDCKGACKCWLFSYPTWAGYLSNLAYQPTSMETGPEYQQKISSSSYNWSVSHKVFLFQTIICFLFLPFIPDCTAWKLNPSQQKISE